MVNTIGSDLTEAYVALQGGSNAPTASRTQRITLNVLLQTCNICLYINRVSISSAVVYMYSTDSERSQVLSSFYYGYLISQIPAASLIVKFGAKAVLMTAVLLWSFAAFLTVLAYDLKLGILPVMLSRVLLGIAEGANYPCQLGLITAWIPENEIARTSAFTVTGENIGTILAMLGGPFMIDHFGFRSVFWLSGGLGLVWLIPFYFLAANKIDGSHWEEAKVKTPWRRILSKFSFWVLVATHVCFNWAYYVGLSWLPGYFDDQFSVKIDDLGLYTVLPYIAIFILGNLGAWVADAMLKCLKTSCVRKLMNTMGFTLAATFFYLMGTVQKEDDPSCSGHFCNQAVMYLTAAIATSGLAFSGYWPSLTELCPTYSSAIMSISNSIATIPGILGNLVTGLILSTPSGEAKDWGKVFLLCAILLISGAIVFLLLSERNPPLRLYATSSDEAVDVGEVVTAKEN